MKSRKYSKSLPQNHSIVSFADIEHIPPRAYLTRQERAEYDRVPVSRRAGWLASRFAAKELLAAWGHDHCVISHEQSGRPVVLDSSGDRISSIDISLSHAGDIGAAVVSNSGVRVGIDIESVRNWSDDTLRAFLTEKEYNAVARLEGAEQNIQATRYWTAKEAYLKALGIGLRQHPGSVDVYTIQQERPGVDISWDFWEHEIISCTVRIASEHVFLWETNQQLTLSVP